MMFILIIFFVLTTSFIQGAVKIDLPDGDAPAVPESSPVVITVTKDSEILWGGVSVSRDMLPQYVSRALSASEDLLIAGDQDASYGKVAELLNELRILKVENVGLVFEEGGGSQ
jgi:biopolymer transport protein ExbD